MATESKHYKGAFMVDHVHVMPGCKTHAILEANKPVPGSERGMVPPEVMAVHIVKECLKKEAACYKI